jgi:hypothetical protein
MAEDEHDYKVGHGRPPLNTRFRKGQSGNPGGRHKKNMPALLADALNETVSITIDGEQRQITKREAVVHQLVNKSTTADLRATKMLFDMMKDAEHKAGAASPPPARSAQRTRRYCNYLSRGCAGKSSPRSRRRRPRRSCRRKALMTDDQLTEQLHELKRRNEAPIALVEMLDALLSLDPSFTAKQKRKRSYEIMARALQRLERKDA